VQETEPLEPPRRSGRLNVPVCEPGRRVVVAIDRENQSFVFGLLLLLAPIGIVATLVMLGELALDGRTRENVKLLTLLCLPLSAISLFAGRAIRRELVWEAGGLRVAGRLVPLDAIEAVELQSVRRGHSSTTRSHGYNGYRIALRLDGRRFRRPFHRLIDVDQRAAGDELYDVLWAVVSQVAAQLRVPAEHGRWV
jgi:hypothetical protein